MKAFIRQLAKDVIATTLITLAEEGTKKLVERVSIRCCPRCGKNWEDCPCPRSK